MLNCFRPGYLSMRPCGYHNFCMFSSPVCPERVSQHVNTALAPNASVGESIGSSTAFIADPIVFLLFSAFLLCTMINLFVLGIIIIYLQKLTRIREG